MAPRVLIRGAMAPRVLIRGARAPRVLIRGAPPYILPEVFIWSVVDVAIKSSCISDGSLYFESHSQSQFSSQEDTVIGHLPAWSWWTWTIYSRERQREREGERGRGRKVEDG